MKFLEVYQHRFPRLFGPILRICIVYSLVRLSGDSSLRFESAGSESKFWMTPAMIHTMLVKDPYLMSWRQFPNLFKREIRKQVILFFKAPSIYFPIRTTFNWYYSDHPVWEPVWAGTARAVPAFQRGSEATLSWIPPAHCQPVSQASARYWAVTSVPADMF